MALVGGGAALVATCLHGAGRLQAASYIGLLLRGFVALPKLEFELGFLVFSS